MCCSGCSLLGEKELWNKTITVSSDGHNMVVAETIGTNFSEIWIKNVAVFFLKMHLEMLSAKWPPFGTSVIVSYYNGDVIMGAIASLITSLTIVYSTVYSDEDQRKHQSSASLAFVWGIHRGAVNSPHKWPVTWKMFPFDDVIVCFSLRQLRKSECWARIVRTRNPRDCLPPADHLMIDKVRHTQLISHWTKWPPFRRRHFQMHFCEWKVLCFDWSFTEVCS